MTATEIKVGDKVRINIADDAALYGTAWWPKRGVEVTGTVQKVFKNGKVAVAVHQVKNKSDDGCHTINFTRETVASFEVIG